MLFQFTKVAVFLWQKKKLQLDKKQKKVGLSPHSVPQDFSQRPFLLAQCFLHINSYRLFLCFSVLRTRQMPSQNYKLIRHFIFIYI